MSFTPGPWEAKLGNDGHLWDYGIIQVIEGSGFAQKIIAVPADVDEVDDNWEADARLIAAAPDSYHVAQLARDCRRAQRAYFADRTKENLIASKQLEKQLDAAVTAYFKKASDE